MSNPKCPNCGLVNFASADKCKRCQTELQHASSYPYWPPRAVDQTPKPDWSKLQTAPAIGPAVTVNLADYESHPIGNVLFEVYLGLTIAFTFVSLLYLPSAIQPGVWKFVIDPANQMYLPTIEPLFYLGWLAAFGFFFATVVLLLLMFRKSSAFLKLVPFYLGAQFFYFVLEGGAVFKLAGEMRDKHLPETESLLTLLQLLPYLSLMALHVTAVWFIYFTASKRARMVFE